MDFSKLSNGQKVAGISALVFIISIFLPWYTLDTPFGSASGGPFESVLSTFGVLFLLGAIIVIAVKMFGASDFALGSLKPEQIALVLAGVGAVLVLIKLIFGHEEAGIDLDRGFGLFLGFIGAAGLTAGAFMMMQEAGLEMPDIDDFKSFGGGDEPPPPPPQ
jgi:hypothetical protein